MTTTSSTKARDPRPPARVRIFLRASTRAASTDRPSRTHVTRSVAGRAWSDATQLPELASLLLLLVALAARLVTRPPPSVRPFVRSFVRSFVCSFLRPSVRPSLSPSSCRRGQPLARRTQDYLLPSRRHPRRATDGIPCESAGWSRDPPRRERLLRPVSTGGTTLGRPAGRRGATLGHL